MRMVPRLGLLLTLGGATLLGADPAALIAEAQAAEARLDSPRALELFRQADAARPDDPVILQRIARQYSDLTPEQPTRERRQEFAQQALAYATRAAELDPASAVNALSVAICHGHLAAVSDARKKIERSRLVHQWAERALQLDPNYAWAHHILGRWHYEVAELGATARSVVRWFYGGLPPASLGEAVRRLQRATELEPGELNHWLDLGFAYAAAGQSAQACAAWERGLAMPNASRHDAAAKARARTALAALR